MDIQTLFIDNVVKGDYDEVNRLINEGVDIHKVFGCNSNALLAAALYGHTEICRLLIEKGINVNQIESNMGRNALMITINTRIEETNRRVPKENVEICELLINAGIDINHVDKNGFNALLIAAIIGKKEICKMLINAGIKNECEKEKCEFALHYCSSSEFDEIRKFIQRSIE